MEQPKSQRQHQVVLQEIQERPSLLSLYIYCYYYEAMSNALLSLIAREDKLRQIKFGKQMVAKQRVIDFRFPLVEDFDD